ncbi:MAG: LysR family transcriptional regulator [Clostridiales bacterium]|nr:LysR family transcriptional regulator [Clostridiales bacterium]
MDLKQLQYFVVSVDSGSFKRAAEALYTSQPHISKTIRALETELQVELLKRKARGVEVTEAGKKVYEYACRILVESGRIQNIRESQNVRVLRIAANAGEGLSSLFRSYYREELKKGLHAQYMECSMEEIFQALHRHTAELGFVYVELNQMTVFRQILDYRRLEFTELKRTQPMLFVGPGSALYHADSVTSRELRELSYVQLEEDQDSWNLNLLQGQEDYQHHKRRGRVLTTNSRSLMTQMILETELGNVGSGLMPEFSEDGRIRGIPIRGTEESIIFGYIRRKRGELSPEAERFVGYVEEQMHKTLVKSPFGK